MTELNNKTKTCEYFEFVVEYGCEYHLCHHPDKQDVTSDLWSDCILPCDFIGE
jgi:hypothetical protein